MVSFPAKRSLCENPGIPGEKSLNLKQISPSRGLGIENDSCRFSHHLIMPILKLGDHMK